MATSLQHPRGARCCLTIEGALRRAYQGVHQVRAYKLVTHANFRSIQQAETRMFPSTVHNPGPVDCANHAHRSQRFYADVRTAHWLGAPDGRAVVGRVRYHRVLRQGIAPDDPSLVRKAQVRYVGTHSLNAIRSRVDAGGYRGGLALRSLHSRPCFGHCVVVGLGTRLLPDPSLKLVKQDALAENELGSRQRQPTPERAINFWKTLHTSRLGRPL